jgi:hypothetical protein
MSYDLHYAIALCTVTWPLQDIFHLYFLSLTSFAKEFIIIEKKVAMGRTYFTITLIIFLSFLQGGCRSQIGGGASTRDHAIFPVKAGGGGQKNGSPAA